MIGFANAKINIGLDVVSKRDDGYHNISSIFYPIPYYDVVEVIKTDDQEVKLLKYGAPIDGTDEENLCVMAYHLLQQHYQIGGAEIHLLKNIPLGAGLGGGSSDAAVTLKLLNAVFGLNLKESQLFELAMQLGSDCGFFIENKAAFVRGRGEIIRQTDFDLSGSTLVVLSPDIHVSTGLAYAQMNPKPASFNLENINDLKSSDWQSQIKNDFEEFAFREHPVLLDLKMSLLNSGAYFASLTGSGSSVYGLFHEKEPHIGPFQIPQRTIHL